MVPSATAMSTPVRPSGRVAFLTRRSSMEGEQRRDGGTLATRRYRRRAKRVPDSCGPDLGLGGVTVSRGAPVLSGRDEQWLHARFDKGGCTGCADCRLLEMPPA
jgi:hypothetical protein